MEQLEQIGIQTLVIPGNHDINNPYAYKITDEGITKAENITAEDFVSIYEEYGYGEAIERDKNSLSYAAEISEGLWVLMFDTCIYQNRFSEEGTLSYETKEWALEIAKKAKKQEKQLLCVSHHNMLQHNKYFDTYYTVSNSERFVGELVEQGVRLNLSGHMHIMNIVQSKVDKEESFYDVALESLAVWPNLYGQLDINKTKEMCYTTHQIEYPGNSYQYLYLLSWQKACEELSEYPVTEQEKNSMAAFLTRINEDYFSGRLKEKEFYTEQKAYTLWKEKAEDSFFAIYMEEILNTKCLDNTWLLLEN
ncbi:MAG: hypothetical protein ACOCM4_15565 [Acetivibrio ethanolgignens]